MKKNIAFAIIAFIISFTCLFGLIYTPQTIKEYQPNEEDLVLELKASDVSAWNSVELAPTGEYTILDADPYVIFNISADSIKTIALKIQPLEENCPVFLYVDGGTGFYEGSRYVSVVPAGEQYACFEITEASMIALRFDIDKTVCIEAIELHSDEATFQETKYPLDMGLLIMAIVVSFAIAVITFFINKQWNVVDRICEFFIQKRKEICIGFAAFVGVAVVAVPCEFIVARYILNMFSRGTAFNWNRYLFIICFLYVFVFLFLMKKYIEKNLEAVILGLILIIGSTMILTQPLAHCGWDVDSHYRFAHASSYLGDAYVTMADKSFFTAAYESVVKPNGVLNLGNVRYMNMAYEYVLEVKDTEISLPHLPAGIAMAVTRLFGGSFQTVFLSGEFINLFIYAFLTYFAIRKLKSGKMILAVFSLFPTNFVSATNFSYDYWVTGFTMLGVAYFIGECQDREHQISIKDTIIMCGSLALACVPKQLYVPLMLLPFLMPKDKIKNKKIYYTICIACFVLLFSSLLMRTSAEVAAGGDTRGGGSAVDVVGQLYYILENPLDALLLLVSHLRSYLSLGCMYQCITNYANLGVTTWGSNIFILVLAYVVITDKNEYDQYSQRWWIKGYVMAMYLGIAVLVSLSFYLVFTPVGANYIDGCQARYMFPAMIPFLMMVAPHGTRNTMNLKLYRYGVLGIVVFITLMDNFMYTVDKML